MAFKKRNLQIFTWPIVPIVIIGGIWYPLFGGVVLAVMLTAIGMGIYRGRYMCGWLCPRGAFYDRIIKHISPHKPIPKLFRNKTFRWSIFALLMALLTFQISLDAGNIDHWGKVLVRMCFVTTSIGIVLAIIYHPRTWCTFCPMGTLQQSLGKIRKG